jgi:DNA-binding CsgD family transcriptional regulator
MAKSSSNAARVTLRQLCNMGLPSSVMLPSILASVRDLVKADHAGFFFCDEQGNMTNLYAERMLPPEAMAAYYENHYTANISAFAKEYLGKVHAKDPVSTKSISDQEKKGNYYLDVLLKLDVEHILYGIVRSSDNRNTVIGQLSLYRSAAASAFNNVEADALRDVLHYLGKALVPHSYTKVAKNSEQVLEEGVGIFNEAGEQLYADAAWLKLARLARGEPITPKTAKEEPKALALFLSGILISASAAKNSVHVVESPWGKFAFRHYMLKGNDGSLATALAVSRLAIDSVQLAEGAARLGLSAQQREVALMVALGKTNSEIADQLGVTVNTAGYHVKQLFTKLEVSNRGDVATLLRVR